MNKTKKYVLTVIIGIASLLMIVFIGGKKKKEKVLNEQKNMHIQGFYEKYVKRVQDTMLAIVILVVMAPVFFIVAILVRFRLGTPVIFIQERPGLHGKIFKLYKFRSMTDEKDEVGRPLPDERRLTAFGKKLRSSSLDELPELFNVIRGDMALVGPRPLLVEYLPLYTQYQARRHEVRPGITGLAQISGRNSLSWKEKLEYDVFYVDRVSFFNDWKIIFKTVITVLSCKGITSDTSATMEKFEGN